MSHTHHTLWHVFIGPLAITVDHVITFLEFLAGSGLSTPTILTYISAIKNKCSQFGIPYIPWSHPRVKIMLRSCSRTIMSPPDPKEVLTPQTLTRLIQLVNLLPLGPLYTAASLLAFYGFFRISNLLPLTSKAFQPSNHLTRGDVSITSTGVTVFIKWTKTLQASRDTRLIPLASIPGSPSVYSYLNPQLYPTTLTTTMSAFLKSNP